MLTASCRDSAYQGDDADLLLEGVLVTPALAKAYIAKNDLVLLTYGTSRASTKCDTLISAELGFRTYPAMGCIVNPNQKKTLEKFNAVMAKELKKRGIEDWVMAYINRLDICLAQQE